MIPNNPHQILCTSGKHPWKDEEDRKRCCNGYARVMGFSREELESEGCEHVAFRQLWRGWKKTEGP